MRTFFTRRTDIRKQLWKTLVQCQKDYCSQLYVPGQAQVMLAIDKLFYDLISGISEKREENYWKRIQILKMYSQERRMERYRLIYFWKILEEHVPNCGIDLAQENARLGGNARFQNENQLVTKLYRPYVKTV